MRISKGILTLVILLLSQQIFARDMDMSMDPYNKACVDLTNACIAAAYDQENGEKRLFWNDCMKPLLLGQQVKDVIVNQPMVTSCRAAKMNDLINELADLQKVDKSAL